MNILIAGGGKVGAALTRQLSAEGYNLTLIDSKKEVLESSVNRYDVMAVQGNCASMEVLQRANVQETDLLIAATSADEVNLLCCMTAHALNPRLHTIARIRSPEYLDQTYKMRDLFGLSLAVNPENQAAQEIERLLKYPGFLRRDTFARGRVEIVELRINAQSKLCRQPLSALDSIVKCRVLVCAVLRAGTSVTPDGNFVLEDGDRIFVTAPTGNLTTLLKNLGIITRRVKRVLIGGGGRISYYLAERLLKSGMDVTIIESNHERCLVLAGLLPGASIIHGDASNEDLLEQQGLTCCDALVSLTGLDELNMLIALYGNIHHIPQIVTKLGHVESSHIINSLPLGSVIYPKEVCSSIIVRYVRALKNQTGAALTVHAIADGQAEAVEFAVDKDTLHCGVPLKDIKLRPNVLIVCISHGRTTEIPNGDSSFKEGDTVLVVASGNHIIYQLNDIFED